MTKIATGRSFRNMSILLLLNRCLLITSATYIQVHFSLDLMEANELSPDETAFKELS